MKKLILALSVIFCLSCSHKQHAANNCVDGSCPMRQVDTELKDVIAQDNWQFALPGEGWKSIGSESPTIKALFNNEQKEMTVLFNKEETELSFADYVVQGLRTPPELGIKVESLSTTTIANTRAVVVTIRHTDKIVWLWLLKKGNYAYGFSCGVTDNPDASTQQFQLCESIANSVQIK
jgi:hypothetical protein